jgi:hypothetical protein
MTDPTSPSHPFCARFARYWPKQPSITPRKAPKMSDSTRTKQAKQATIARRNARKLKNADLGN